MRRPRNSATNAIRAPTATERGVCHSTLLMLTYHFGALSGSDAYADTSDGGRSITTALDTSTLILFLRNRSRSSVLVSAVSSPHVRAARVARRADRAAPQPSAGRWRRPAASVAISGRCSREAPLPSRHNEETQIHATLPGQTADDRGRRPARCWPRRGAGGARPQLSARRRRSPARRFRFPRQESCARAAHRS